MNAANSPKPILLLNRLFYCQVANSESIREPHCRLTKQFTFCKMGGNNLILFDCKLTT
mgnify:CR=1 FL=1